MTTQAHPETIQVLFIQGGGDGGYEADSALAASLQTALGSAYNVRYPRMPDEDAPDFGWGAQIDRELAAVNDEVVLVGHSVGASILLKHLSETRINHQISGIFLVSAPFWGGDETWQYESLNLRENFAAALPPGVPIFLYHSRDDEEADISHLAMYADKLPHASVRELPSGGHQLGNDLTPVAQDIKNLP